MREFFRFVGEMEAVVEQKKWPLVKKFNKSYVTFKAGFPNVFGIIFIGSKTFAFFVKISEAQAKALTPPPSRYETQWKQATYIIDPKNTRTDSFVPIFEAAYQHQVKKD